MPASSSACARLSGVCPPNWTITPTSVAVLLLDVQDFEHVLGGQRFEIETVRGVIVGAHRLRVAVDHDRLIAGFLERIAGVAAAIVELDPLPDPVRPAAEDDDLASPGRHRLTLGLAEARRLIGRVHIGGLGLELGRAGVDPLEHRAHAELVAVCAHLLLGDPAGHRDDGFVDQPRSACDRFVHAARAGWPTCSARRPGRLSESPSPSAAACPPHHAAGHRGTLAPQLR